MCVSVQFHRKNLHDSKREREGKEKKMAVEMKDGREENLVRERPPRRGRRRRRRLLFFTREKKNSRGSLPNIFRRGSERKKKKKRSALPGREI